MNREHIKSLHQRRALKVKEQRGIALRMNHSLTTSKDGYNEVSRKTRKNLEAAVVASKKPGFFNYYEPPAHIKSGVKNGEMKQLVAQVQKNQKEIDQLDLELQMAENKRLAMESNKNSSQVVSTMSQWFKTYGAPKPEPSAGYTTRFVASSKVYRGYGDKKAFRTQSSTMKPGRLCQ